MGLVIKIEVALFVDFRFLQHFFYIFRAIDWQNYKIVHFANLPIASACPSERGVGKRPYEAEILRRLCLAFRKRAAFLGGRESAKK